MHVQQQPDSNGVKSDAEQTSLWEVEQLALETACLLHVCKLHKILSALDQALDGSPWGTRSACLHAVG